MAVKEQLRRVAKHVPYLGSVLRSRDDLLVELNHLRNELRSSTLDLYTRDAPSPQGAADLFRGEWIPSLPQTETSASAGSMPLWADTCLQWGLDHLGGVRNADVLELGSLEGSHSYVLEKCGASSVLAIEGNSRAYLRSLVAKEILGLERCRFTWGDFMAYLRTCTRRFDLIVASGVLYHQVSPIELLQLLAERTDRLYLWTHYYDETFMRNNPAIAARFSPGEPATFAGLAHTLHRQEYRDALGTKLFCGGSASYSHWLPRQDILNALRFFGFKEICVGHENPAQVPGPLFAVTARR